MRLGTRARYALRMMLDVASNGGEEEPVGITAVARRTGLSRAYLEQLALALRVGRLLKGVSGRHGGYRLAAPASDITIGQIIEDTAQGMGVHDLGTPGRRVRCAQQEERDTH